MLPMNHHSLTDSTFSFSMTICLSDEVMMILHLEMLIFVPFLDFVTRLKRLVVQLFLGHAPRNALKLFLFLVSNLH